MTGKLRNGAFSWLSTGVLMLAAASASADTLHVPGQYATIQAAITAAQTGDFVEIAAGTYIGAGNKNLDFDGKAITVRGVSCDPALCIIDCEGDGRGFYFHNREWTDSIVEGLTITNGCAVGDFEEGFGGGVFCYDSAPTFINCIINGNSAVDGGGLLCVGWGFALINCTVSGNSASGAGGGLLGRDLCGPLVVDSTITNNTAHVGGGIACCVDSYPYLINCTISDNYANYGGGMHCGDHGSPVLINCTLTGNSANVLGGGIRCSFWHSIPTLSNCTFSGNTAEIGGGISNGYMSGAELTNCILWNDSPQEIHIDSGGFVAYYSDIQNAASEPWFNVGCIDADPLFVDPDGPDDDPSTWEDNDYRLAPRSPCIDAGDNTAVAADSFDLDDDGDTDEPLPFDLDGNPRFVDDQTIPDTGVGTPPIVDMGAYELMPGDLDGDGDVDLSDLAELLGRYGSCLGDPVYHTTADFDASGCIDLSDLAYLLGYYGAGT